MPHHRRQLVSLVAGAVIAVILAAPASALEVTTSWSPPLVYSHPPPADLTHEASVRATFLGDQPMDPLDAPWLVRLNDATWRGTWLWDDHEPRTVRFVGADGDTVTVVAARQPAQPLDLAAHDGLVVRIDTEPPHLWHPDTGIYVWGLHENCLQRGEEWERPATITAHAPGGAVQWSEPAGLRINGQSTRYHVRKGLRSYFDDYGFQDWLLADAFGDGEARFSRLIYKTTLLPGHLVSSSLFEPLHRDLGHLGSRHRLCGLYLDGEYWGAYSLRERYDDEFVEITHDLASSGGYTFIKDDEAIEGEVQEWYDFLTAYAVPPQPYGAHDWYTAVAERLDLGSYIDWMMLNIVGAASDNGWVNNVALLRIHGGPWRYLMWDEEGLMAADNLESNHFRFYAAGSEAEFYEFLPPVWSMGWWWPPHQPWRDLFRGLMQNSQFKARFSARLDELLAGPLAVGALHARLDSLEAAHTQELSLHLDRWNQPDDDYVAEMARVRQWLVDRTPVVLAQRDAFLEHFAVPVELSVFAADATVEGAVLQWRTERERSNRGFSVWRSLDGPDDLALLADWSDHPELAGAPDSDEPREYTFLDPGLPPGGQAWYQLRHEDLDGGITVHDWVERAGPPPLPPLRLNELMADNDHVVADEAGEFDDWLELVNASDETVSLAGLALSDDPSDPTPWPLPELLLEPGAFLLIWCDEDLDQGPLHADFKLAAAGESATLFLVDDGIAYPIDSVTFGPQTTDTAYGRYPDGDGPWQVLASATPGAPNQPPTATPSGGPSLVLRHVWPNPADTGAEVRFGLGADAAGPVEVMVYDLRGRLVQTLLAGSLPAGEHRVAWDRRDQHGHRAAAGVYLLRVTAGGEVRTEKLSLVR